MDNPYEDVKWQSVIRVASATHLHLRNQHDLHNGYRHGLRHFPISNYYPSAPYDAATRLSDFRLRQWWGTKPSVPYDPDTQISDFRLRQWRGTKRAGKPLKPPVNWNDIITWQDELEEPYRTHFPFVETDPVFADIPDDVILSHNAEHHTFTNLRCHVCSPGSSFASGNFDVHGHYHLNKHGFCAGFGDSWQEGFEGMLQGLDYPDGGGIIINHPTWYSWLSDDEVLEMLDFDERVLGIEIYNDHSAKKNWFKDAAYKAPSESEPGFSLNLWDRILATRRRCWGFCVPDHNVCKGENWHGRSILLVPEFTEENCLKAYRQGQFYGCLKGSDLAIRDFTATDSAISVSISAPARIKFITEAGPARTIAGKSATYELPQKNGALALRYVRVEIEDDSGERLFLQPVMW